MQKHFLELFWRRQSLFSWGSADGYCHIYVEWRDVRQITEYIQARFSVSLVSASGSWYLTEDILWDKSSLDTKMAAVSISLRSGSFR